MKARRDRTGLAALAPFLWLGLFFLFPFLLVAKLSLSDTALAIPPYTPRIDYWSAGLAGLKTFFAAVMPPGRTNDKASSLDIAMS